MGCGGVGVFRVWGVGCGAWVEWCVVHVCVHVWGVRWCMFGGITLFHKLHVPYPSAH